MTNNAYIYNFMMCLLVIIMLIMYKKYIQNVKKSQNYVQKEQKINNFQQCNMKHDFSISNIICVVFPWQELHCK